MIRLQSIKKSYTIGKEAVEVLKGIDLHIHKGEFTAIMGPSGSGKSTLMNMIGCLDSPTSGEYYLNELLVSDYDENELARVRNQSIGFVFQQFQLLATFDCIEKCRTPDDLCGDEKERTGRTRD